MVQFVGIALVVLFYAVGVYVFFIFRSKHPDDATRISRNKMRKILSGAFMFYISVVLGFMIFFSGSGKTVSAEELMAIVEQRAASKVQWHYIGTFEGYDYFHFTDTEGEGGFRVKEGEIILEGRFLPETNKAVWVPLPW